MEISCPDHSFEECLQDGLSDVLETLTDREQQAITGVFLEGDTIVTTGKTLERTDHSEVKRVGLTRGRTAQIVNKALRKLQHPTRLRTLAKHIGGTRELCNAMREANTRGDFQRAVAETEEKLDKKSSYFGYY